MSLINQVLHAVEQRQQQAHGSALKPVLPVHAPEPTRWRVWGWPLLVTALLVTGISTVMQGAPAFSSSHNDASAFVAPIQSWLARLQMTMPSAIPTPAMTQTQGGKLQYTHPDPASQATTERVLLLAGDAQPRLARQLSHDWQRSVTDAEDRRAEHSSRPAMSASTTDSMSTSQAASLAPSPVPSAVSSAVQAIAEPAVTLSAISGSSPATRVGTAPANTGGSASSKGQVVKQVKPEQSANEWIQRAMDHEQKGRMSEAMQAAKQAVVLAPASEDARLLLSSYQFEAGLEPEAVQTLQAGIQAQTDSVALRKALAKWQLGHGQALAAIEVLKPVAAGSAQDAEWHWLLAMCYQQSGQHQAALPWFARATNLSPAQAQWLVAYAVSLQAVGQTTQALQQLQAAQNLPMSERMAEFVAQRVQQLSASTP